MNNDRPLSVEVSRGLSGAHAQSPYPSGLFDFVQGVMRWHNRAAAYVALLVKDRPPPLMLAE